MNKFTFIFSFLMMFLFTSIMAQDIFPRTYTGTKDAAVDGIEDASKNLYILGSNGSGLSDVRSAEEGFLLENIGSFVTKLDKYGITIWYKILDGSNYNFAGNSKITLHGNFVYALFKNKIYKLRQDNGNLVSTYDITSDGDSVVESSILDFVVIKPSGAAVHLILVTKDSTLGVNTYCKIIKDNGSTYSYVNNLNFYSDAPSLNEKLMYVNNQLYYGTLYYDLIPGGSFINFMGSGGSTIWNLLSSPNGKFYVLYKYNLTYSGGVFNFTFQNILNGIDANLPTTESYAINDYDIDKDPNLGEYLIYGTGRLAGDNDGKIYAIKANSFGLHHPFDVAEGEKDAFTAHNGKVNYVIVIWDGENEIVKYIHGDELNAIDLETENSWSKPTLCFRPLDIIDSTIPDTIYPIGYYGGSCNLNYPIIPGYWLPNYSLTGVQTAVTRMQENGTSYLFERQYQNGVDLVIQLSPNPASEFIYIDSNEKIEGKLFIFDQLNQNVYNSIQSIALNKFKLNVSDWRSGIYFLQFVTEQGQVFNQQFIVK